MDRYRAAILAGLVLLTGGCSTPKTIYYWGHYQNLIYESYAAPGKIPPESQVEQLEADYQKARSLNQPVPPGFHAYLGYLYFQLGKLDQAKQEFETEKNLFPESAVFMDRMLANLKKS